MYQHFIPFYWDCVPSRGTTLLGVDSFPVWAVRHNAARNIRVQAFVWTYALVDFGVKSPGYRQAYVSLLKKLSLSQSRGDSFYAPTDTK